MPSADPLWMAVCADVRAVLLLLVSAGYLVLVGEMLWLGRAFRYPVFFVLLILMGLKGLRWTAGLFDGYAYYEPLVLAVKAGALLEAFWLITAFTTSAERLWLFLTAALVAAIAFALSTGIAEQVVAARAFARYRHQAHIAMAVFSLISAAHFVLRPVDLPAQLRTHGLLLASYVSGYALLGFLNYPAASAATRLLRWKFFYAQAITFLLLSLAQIAAWAAAMWPRRTVLQLQHTPA